VALEDGEIHGVETEGFTGDEDGEKTWGGRIGLLPIPALEIGLSGGFGDVGPEGEEDLRRDYTVYGADASYRFGKSLDLRAEYVRTEVGSNALSAAPESAEWETWYAQAAYRFLPTKWEAVVRYGEFDSPHAHDDQEQWGFGVNYWFAPNAVAKLGYEVNDGEAGEPSDDNRTLLQLSYGF
jgi:predicted porin